MLTLFSSRKLLIVVVVILAVVSSCRKDIDFDQAQDFNSEGAIDPTKPILEPWTSAAAVSYVDHIASDGQNIYYSIYAGGQTIMYKLDTSGTSTYLFNVSFSDDIQLIEYIGSKLYFTQKVANGFGRVHAFDETGLLNTYDVDVNANDGTILTTLVDLGSQLLVAGQFGFEVPNLSRNVCLIDKTTGALTHLSGLGYNKVTSAAYHNDEIYITGKALTGNSSSTTGKALAKWTGTQWQLLGPYTLDDDFEIAPIGTCIGSYNGKILMGGKLRSAWPAIYEYSSMYNDFIGNQGFGGTNTTGQNINIQMRTFDGVLYAFGQIRFSGASFNSVYVMENNAWRSIGALDADATDLAICQGYAYALVNGQIKKYPL